MFSKNQLQILTILLNQPDREYYLSEIGYILQKQPGAFQKGINSLEKQGYITSRKKGNQRLFLINQQHPLYQEIKKIIQKTYGVEGLLKKLVESIAEINCAFIYGSYVKDTMRADSDIDLIIRTVDVEIENTLLQGITQIEEKVQREINYKIYLVYDFQEKIKEKNPFLEEILSEKYILLKGSI